MPEREPMTEEEIRAANVGRLQPTHAPITLADYDPEWPRLFEREAARVRSILGDTALRIEHAGSTSVPGLPAKPIIDIVLVVPDSTDEGAYLAPLADVGYRLKIREPDWFEHRLLKGPDTNINMHVLSDGCDEIDRMLAFRDHLRANEEDRELYLRTKRELAARTWKYVQNYADAKSAVIAGIMDRAYPRSSSSSA